MMEFSREIAVLQSAFSLANQLCPGGLQLFKKHQHTKPLQVLQEAIAEIIEGLECDRSPSENARWQHKLAAICTYLLQRYLRVNTETADSYFEAVSTGLPSINSDLFFELVKNQGWIINFIQLLDEMDESASLTVINTLLNHVSMATDNQDVDLLMNLCQYLFMFQNSLMFKYCSYPEKGCTPGSKDSNNYFWDIIAKVVELVTSTEIVGKNDAEIKTLQILMLLSRLLGAQTSGKCYSLKQKHLKPDSLISTTDKTSTNIQRVGRTGHYLVLDGSTKVIESPFVETDFCLPEQISSLLWQRVIHLESRLTEIAKSGSGHVTNVLNDLWRSPRMLSALCRIPSQILREELEQGFVAFCEFLSIGSEHREQWLQREQTQEISGTLQLLHEVVKQRTLNCSQEAESTDRRLDAACFIIAQHMESYLDWCDWLLDIKDEAVWKDPRYLQCFEGNVEAFITMDREIDFRAIRRLHHMSLIDRRSAADIQSVMVAIFEKFSTVQQVQVLHRALCVERWKFPLSPAEDFQHCMTFTFNRLVNSNEEETDNLVKQVAVLGLQQPVLVLGKLVDTAVRSAAQTQLLAQILQELPPLAALKVEQSERPIICDRLLEVITGHALSRQEVQNLKIFLRILLQPYRSKLQNAKSHKEDAAVLSCANFIQCCILPHLESSPDSSSVSMEMALSLLLVTVETVKSSKPDWSMGMQCHMYPIMLCLCHVIEECRDMWIAEGGLNKVVVKELAVDALECILTIVIEMRKSSSNKQENTEMEKALRWLQRKLDQGFHWTTPLYVLELLGKRSSSASSPVEIADDLRRLLAVSPELNVSYKQTEEDGFASLFELCRVSEYTFKLVTEALKAQGFEQDCYRRLLGSLAQVLPHSTLEEWQRITKVLQKLVELNTVQSSTFPNMFTDLKPELVVPTLLFQTLQVLLATSGERTRQEATTSQWLHLAKCYTSTLKNVRMLDIDDQSDTNYYFEVQAELLSHLCLCLHLLPEGSTEPIYVLTLDLLNSCSSLAQQLRETANRSTVQDCVTHIGSAIELVDNVSQRLNLDKLFQEIVCI